MLRLETLASGAGADEVLDYTAHIGEVEVAPEPVESALYPLVAIIMHRGHNLGQKGRGRWHVQPAGVGDQPVDDAPWRRARAGCQFIADGNEGGILSLSLPEPRDEVELGS
jgi:hypothetical protein